jgi:uncharacterized pyridoxamine 5'-phosphate oxidase family protein
MPKKAKSKTKLPKSTRPHIPGYGLPKSRKGLLPWKWAEDRLKKSRQYWIATTRPDGRPHVMVIWALWLHRQLYFSTGKTSRKAQNLKRNPHCTMCSDNSAEAVVVEGKVETEKDVERIREFLEIYEKKYKFDMSDMADDLLKLKEPVFRLRAKIAFGLAEKTFSKSATRWIF